MLPYAPGSGFGYVTPTLIPEPGCDIKKKRGAKKVQTLQFKKSNKLQVKFKTFNNLSNKLVSMFCAGFGPLLSRPNSAKGPVVGRRDPATISSFL